VYNSRKILLDAARHRTRFIFVVKSTYHLCAYVEIIKLNINRASDGKTLFLIQLERFQTPTYISHSFVKLRCRKTTLNKQVSSERISYVPYIYYSEELMAL